MPPPEGTPTLVSWHPDRDPDDMSSEEFWDLLTLAARPPEEIMRDGVRAVVKATKEGHLTDAEASELLRLMIGKQVERRITDSVTNYVLFRPHHHETGWRGMWHRRLSHALPGMLFA